MRNQDPVFSGCGICGALQFQNQAALGADVSKMTDSLQHRGPNGKGYFESDLIQLGHRRLSILDLSEDGAQPMTRDHLTIVYNGELYNYVDLKKELSHDFQFQSRTDTEVVLRAFQKWGAEALTKFVGMFAFAIWDARHQRLTLARDQIGVKPLYYSFATQGLVFASEVEALLTSGVVKADVDFDSLRYQILCSSTMNVNAEATLVKGVLALPAGHLLEAQTTGSKSLRRFWGLPPEASVTQVDQLRVAKDFQQLFYESTQSMLIGDVPVAAFLSGGLDSSAIAVNSIGRQPMKLITVAYGDASETREKSETANDVYFSQRLVEFLNRENITHQVIHQPNDLSLNDIDSVCDLAALGDDLRHVNILRNYRSVANAGLKVVLNGQGADETMGGYVGLKSFIENACDILNPNKNQLLALPASRRSIPTALLSSDVLRYQARADQIFSEFLDQLPDEPIRRTHTLLFQSQLQRVLKFEDFLSMKTSVEARVPFLDHRLVEFCFSIPFEYHLDRQSRTGKKLLRLALENKVPDELLKRPKQVFPPPDKEHAHASLLRLLEQNQREILNSELVRSVFANPSAEIFSSLPLNAAWVTLWLWRFEERLGRKR